MYIDKIYENNLFPELKAYLADNSAYNPKLVKTYTYESKVFPIVTMVVTNSENNYNTLTYGEPTEDFTIEINVYANDKGNISKRTIANEVTDWIIKWWKENYHVAIDVRKDFANIDNSIHRNYIKIKGVVDAKYGEDGLLIYPTLNTHKLWY